MGKVRLGREGCDEMGTVDRWRLIGGGWGMGREPYQDTHPHLQ